MGDMIEKYIADWRLFLCDIFMGVPVQQTGVSLFGERMNSYVNFVISAPIAILLAVITHLISDIVNKELFVNRK